MYNYLIMNNMISFIHLMRLIECIGEGKKKEDKSLDMTTLVSNEISQKNMSLDHKILLSNFYTYK